MKRLQPVIYLFLLLFSACTLNEEKLPEFSEAPELTITPVDGVFRFNWVNSVPDADSYDIYWIKDTDNPGLDRDFILENGIRIDNAQQGSTTFVLNEGDTISALISAEKSGYKTAYSDIAKETLQTPPPFKPPVQDPSKAFKRGVGYNFSTLNSEGGFGSPEKRNPKHAGRDMDLLMGGKNGITWFYAWGDKPDPAVAIEAYIHDLEFCPMAWNDGFNENNIRSYVQTYPGVKYIMAFNEPNFYSQANLTPAQAAAAWPRLKNLAGELDLKIVSPGMNYGPMMGPTDWLDQFFSQPGVSIDDVCAIAVHTYPWWPSAVKSILDNYRKYDKPLWLTEFCGWEDLQNRTASRELQAWYMSMVIVYLEMDPMVERYAWYIPKGHVPQNSSPFHNLLTDVPSLATAVDVPELTDLGIIYTNITICDKDVWIPAGQLIDAAQFTSCNLANNIGITNSWSDTVLFRPTGDTGQSAGVLEIHEFRNTMWLEYQVSIPSEKNYTLSLRNKTVQATVVSASIDNGSVQTVNLNSDTWTTSSCSLGNITAGNHTIRLQVNSGNCALNWLKIE